MRVLGIESTCDETACSVVKEGREILSNVVASQADFHRKFGGVVPELACRHHVDLMIPVIDNALKEASLTLKEIDLFAVAHGPGLIGALLIGVHAAKALALAMNKPFIGVNHIEAHLYAAMMSSQQSMSFPCLGVVLSGGHTALVLIKEIGVYELIGQTIDDAIGEAFDKVAKILNLPYPGGPQIERLAQKGDPKKYPFKAGKIKNKRFDFSFSGLKTAVLYTIKGQNADAREALFDLSISKQADLAASFQEAALSDVVTKTLLAAKLFQCTTIVLGGGVTNNQRLREMFRLEAPYLQFLWPSEGLSLDNAAMIAGLGYHTYLRKGCASFDLEALPNIPFIKD